MSLLECESRAEQQRKQHDVFASNGCCCWPSSSLPFGSAPQSLWPLLAVPSQQPNASSNPTCGLLERRWAILHLHGHGPWFQSSSSSPTLALAQDPVPLVPTALAHDDDAQVVARWANPKKPLGSLSTPSRQYHAFSRCTYILGTL